MFYKRYIDDGFGIWTRSLQSLQEFARYANNIHRSIQIELHYSQEKIEFLDTWVKLENGRVYTDLYKRPSDKQLYLKKSSCHPYHTKTGLADGLALRIRLICEKDEDYSRHRKKLKVQPKKRGYAGKFVERQLQSVDNQKKEAFSATYTQVREERWGTFGNGIFQAPARHQRYPEKAFSNALQVRLAEESIPSTSYDSIQER